MAFEADTSLQARNTELLELEEISRNVDDGRRTLMNPLPAADGGRAAWLFLAGSFVIETLLWGFPFSYGVLQEYYSTHEPMSLHSSGIGAVGTTCSGIMYLAAPLMFDVLRRWPEFRRTSLACGLVVVTCAILTSSFATTVWQLLLTQGLMYGFGGGFLYYPIFFFIDEWFVRRKGFAYGIMWAGSGCGGLVGPLMINWGLARYGPNTLLRGWALALVLLIGSLLYFVRPRLPPSRNAMARSVEFGFVRTKTFWALQTGNVVQGLGYFVPALYLPAYARSLNFSNLTASLIVAALNTASVPGVIFLSALSDRWHVTNVVLVSALGSAFSVFLLWGLSTSLPILCLFAVSYGFFASGFTATYAGTVQEMRRITPGSELGSIFGLLSLGRGVGNVVCGPVSEALLKYRHLSASARFAYGSDFGVLITFTGVTASLAMIGWILRALHFA